MTSTNIKHLPEGSTYWTEYGYSQSYPWVEVKRTAKTVTLARIETEVDPEWKAKIEFHPGGFCGHVSNQHEQTWLYAGLGTETKTIRLTKNGWRSGSSRFVQDVAQYFYDYNF